MASSEPSFGDSFPEWQDTQFAAKKEAIFIGSLVTIFYLMLQLLKGLDPDKRREILGIAGVAGNGQDELVEAITGLRRPSGGRIELDGISASVPIPSLSALHLEEAVVSARARAIGVTSDAAHAGEKAAAETMALPIFPELTEEQIRYVVESIAGFYA